MKSSDRIFVPYSQVRHLIEEADITLWRSKNLFAKIVQKFTRSPYSHAALLSWHNGNIKTIEANSLSPILELIEFNVGAGGIIKNFDREVKNNSGLIDIYRPSSSFPRYTYDPKYNFFSKRMLYLKNKSITDTMRQLTGLPYGLKRILRFIQNYIPGLRLFYNINKVTDDRSYNVVAPVCSTSIAYCFNVHNFDLVKNLADSYTKPGDLAFSPALNYLFTPVWDD